MAINLDAQTSIRFDKSVFPKEEVPEKKRKSRKRKFDSQDVIYAAVSNNREAKIRKKRAKARQKQISDSRERALQNGRVRKYAKEMQNRDAIVKKSRKMQNRAFKTESDIDDKFALKALGPTKRFDDIVYNSATTDDAEAVLNDMFEDVMDDAESCSD